MKKIKIYILLLGLGILIASCVEEIDLVTETDFESALVVEATITDQVKFQTVRLTRTYRLEEEGPNIESGALIKVVSNCGENYEFTEGSNGVYTSNVEFAAQSNCDYHLEIATQDGRQYSSSNEQLPQDTQIDELYAVRDFNENGDEGVSIYVDTADPTGNSKFYRYEYVETYKIIAPQYSPLELVVLNDDFIYPPEFIFMFDNIEEVIDFFFDIVLREEQEQVCYNTVASNTLILASTTDLVEDALDQFRIRFLGRDNTIISHRYSILVTQYVQSQEAHTYYTALNELAENESILSETQPGFLQGNMVSLSNANEKVVGFFEVSSSDTQRIYFNYADLFPGEIIPPYYLSCDYIGSPTLLEEDFFHNITNSPVIDALNAGFIFYQFNDNNEGSPFAVTPFDMVFRECGDCTVYGDNQVPEWWEE